MKRIKLWLKTGVFVIAASVIHAAEYDFLSSHIDTAVIVHTIPAPVEGCQGLAWDGTHIWVSSNWIDSIYKIDPSDGSVIAQIPQSYSTHIEGLAWVGTHLWGAENLDDADDNSLIFEIDPLDGTPLDTVNPPACLWPHGITYDGEYLWLNDFDTKKLYKIDLATNTLIDSLPLDGMFSIGLAWDGQNLWIDGGTGKGSDNFFCIDPNSGTFLRSIASPVTNPRDHAWADGYLWTVSWETSTIYQLDMGGLTAVNSENRPAAVSISPILLDESGSRIHYTVATDGMAILKLFTAGGRELQTLVNEYTLAGRYSVAYPSCGAGMYYATLTTGSSSSAAKLLLVK